MDTTLRLVAAGAIAYLCGAVPWAVIVVRIFWKQDIRKLGSGNSGATNVLRIFGVPAALTVAVLDIGKGILGVWLATLVAPADASRDLLDWFMVVGAFFSVAGHSYSPFIGFRGGKGVATSAGAVMMLAPWVWPVELAVFALVIALAGIVSVASLTVAVLLPVVCWLLYPGRHILLLFSVLVAVVVVWRHRSNIGRLMRHEEPRISFRKRQWEQIKARIHDRSE